MAAILLGSAVPAASTTPMTLPPPSYTAAQITDMTTNALAGNVDLQLNLGRVYQNGYGVPIDYLAAQTWYKMAADNGSAFAMKEYSEVTQFIAEHAARYAAAMTGDAKAQYLFAVHEPHGATNIPGDYPQGYWLKLSAAQGYSDAESNLGDHYFNAYVYRELYPRADAELDSPSAATDLAGAIEWEEKAAVQGDVRAQAIIADIYAINGPTQNPAKARYWLEQVAASEITQFSLPTVEKLCRLEFTGGLHGHAWYAIAQSTRMDITFAPDYAKAFACYTRINTTFERTSYAYQLGYMYRHGLGIMHDDARALALLTDASQGRDDVTPAKYELAMIYAQGKVVPRNLVKADVLLTEAVKAWDPDAFPGPRPEQVVIPWPGNPDYPEGRYYDQQADVAHRKTAEGWLIELRKLEARMTPADKAKAKAIRTQGA